MSPLQRAPEVLAHQYLHLPLRLQRPRADVRQEDAVLVADEARVDLGLVLVHVQARPPHLAALQCLDERIFVDDRTAGRVDEDDALFHPGELVSGDEPARAGVEGEVDADDVARPEQLLEAHVLGVDRILRRGHPGSIVVLYAHAERDRAPSDCCPDAAHTQYTQRFPFRLMRQAPASAPFACPEGGGGDVDPAKRADYEEQGRVGCGCVDGARSVGDGNATACASGGVNGVVASAIVGNEFEAGRKGIDEFLIEAASHLEGTLSGQSRVRASVSGSRTGDSPE